jgi:hypothetical protein
LYEIVVFRADLDGHRPARYAQSDGLDGFAVLRDPSVDVGQLDAVRFFFFGGSMKLAICVRRRASLRAAHGDNMICQAFSSSVRTVMRFS